jgi:hypothetical protein
MHRLTRILSLAACSLTVASSAAFAGKPANDDDAASSVGAAVEGAPAGWPLQIIDRPLTLKAGMLAPEADVGLSQTSVMAASTTTIGLTVGANYGLSDKLQVGGAYAFSLKDFEIKGMLTGSALYQLVDGQAKAAVGGSFGFNLNGNHAGPIGAGLALAYLVTPKISVFTPASQLAIGIDPSTTLRLNVPIGVGLQATSNVFASVQTNVASIGLSPSGSNAIFGADTVPLTLGAFYSPSNKMDLGVNLSADLKNSPADAFVVGVVARMFTGG